MIDSEVGEPAVVDGLLPRLRDLVLAVGWACATVLLFLSASTLLSLDHGVDSPFADYPAVAEVGRCHRYGPVSLDGFGWFWACEVTVRTADGTVHAVVDGSKVTPNDAGRQVRFREYCDDSGCSYGRPTLWLWRLVVALFDRTAVTADVIMAIVAVGYLVAALIGRPRAERIRARWRAKDEAARRTEPVEAPRPEVSVEPVDRPGLAVDLSYPPSAALYGAATPRLRVDGRVRSVPGWGVYELDAGPGRHRVEVIVVGPVPPARTYAKRRVKVPREGGVILRYRAPDLTAAESGG
ncbi:DUF6346 domain-containing protein [Mangrovihabitans endophyticus]|uniref:Uncharacterized protein n=1 Tax=Mangrovihabitans endophyticus TaxID=1751298 RepID=A0A8J3C2N4_9ACTN|nr:DUF6346 domain-containing protein [Mangrovihabitans endophyticus]GGK98570.1 hypothetical protein GCM10012284_36060 [Mangrovihabitans endophyticus]